MLNVVLGLGRGYTRWRRQLFHRACADEAKSRSRREAGIVLLATMGISLAILVWQQDPTIPAIIAVVGVLIALLTASLYI